MQPEPQVAPPPAAKGFAYYALTVIFLANFFNYMDRQLVSALEDPLSAAFSLDETRFGLLWTLFTIGYMLCAVPIGYLADHISRTKLFSLCIVIWSLATVGSGLAQSEHVLYVARVFIGVGEAGCLVIGPALISDFFARENRGRALSVFFLGLPLGGTAAFILAGLMIKVGMDWRTMFYVAGLPGIPIALLIAFMRDPPRGGSESPELHGHGGSARVKDYVALLKNKTLMLIIVAQAFSVITIIPLIHFGTKFFVDARGLEEDSARIDLGLMALVAGVIGNSLSGWLGDRLARRTKGAYALLAGFGFLVGWPFLLIGFTFEEKWIFLPALTLGCLCYFLCMPAVNTQIANVVNPKQRATAWALAVLILHLLGDMLAPIVFGGFVVHLEHRIGDDARERAFQVFSVSMVLAALCSFVAARTAKKDIERFVETAPPQRVP